MLTHAHAPTWISRRESGLNWQRFVPSRTDDALSTFQAKATPRAAADKAR